MWAAGRISKEWSLCLADDLPGRGGQVPGGLGGHLHDLPVWCGWGRSYCVPQTWPQHNPREGISLVLVTPPLVVYPVYWWSVCYARYNLHHHGPGDLRTLHAACPVIHGTKWGKIQGAAAALNRRALKKMGSRLKLCWPPPPGLWYDTWWIWVCLYLCRTKAVCAALALWWWYQSISGEILTCLEEDFTHSKIIKVRSFQRKSLKFF